MLWLPRIWKPNVTSQRKFWLPGRTRTYNASVKSQEQDGRSGGDYNEMKEVGGAHTNRRPQDRTNEARFWIDSGLC